MDNTTMRLVVLGGGNPELLLQKKPDSGEEGGDLPGLIGW